jgi:uncharacterized membrane protein (DUF2068 family)
MSYHLHHANDDLSHLKGLRLIASIEILKGAVVVVGALALLRLVHRDIGEIAANLLDKLHVPPGASLATHVLQGADAVTPEKIKGLIGFAALYSTVRFVEGYGLWLARIWAEWFAIISGTIYLPWEVYEVIRRVTWLHCAVLLINIGIVLYMVSLRVHARHHLTGPADGRDVEEDVSTRVPG